MHPILSVKNISKSYSASTSLKSRLFSWIFTSSKSNSAKILHNISFDVMPGQSIGLIGVNGAGKSTLLKIISSTLKPSSGEVLASGRIASILELGMGFEPELSGRHNAYQSCSLMGLSKTHIDSIMPYIEDFAEIGSYFDQPVRTYSSGMHMRLAFAIVTAYRPDILIIDEALSVGDIYFQHKSFTKIREFKRLGTTLIIVSHDAVAIKSICDRVILLDSGQIAIDSDPAHALDMYNALLSQKESVVVKEQKQQDSIAVISGDGRASIEEIALLDHNNAKLTLVSTNQPVKLKALVNINASIHSLVFGYQIKDRFGQIVYGTNSFHLQKELQDLLPGQSYEFSFDFIAALAEGSYSISVAIHSAATHIDDNYEWRDLAVVFSVSNQNFPNFIGVANIPPSLNIVKMS